jgi:hypothetical protein
MHRRSTHTRPSHPVEYQEDMPADTRPYPRCGKCPHGHTVALVWQHDGMGMQNGQQFTYPFQLKISPPKPGIVDNLTIRHRHDYARDFCTADEGYYAGQVAATTQNRETHWANWTTYVQPLGLDPFLQGVRYTTKVRVLTGFAARVCRGLYGQGKRVHTGTVVGALTAVGQDITPVCDKNPTKVTGSKKFLPRLQQIYDGWQKEDPPTTKQLPVEANVPELLAEKGCNRSATELERAIGYLSLIAFYYLLRIREYTVKSMHNKTKKNVQFKYEDISFFKKTAFGMLQCHPRDAPAHLIATVDGATMKLDNQKNGCKGVCIYQKANGDDYLCPVKRWFLHLRLHGGTRKTFLSLYWTKGTRADVMAENISRALNSATTESNTQPARGSLSQGSTHTPCAAAALMPLPWRDTRTHKFRRWDDGPGPHLKNTSGKSWHVTPGGCHMT